MVLDIKKYLRETGSIYDTLRSLYIYLNRRDQLCLVPIDICTNPMGFSFGRDGWNYLIEQLREFDKKIDLNTKDSFLFKFHQLYQPRDMSELAYSAGYRVTFKPGLSIYPWGSFHIEKSKIGGEIKDAYNSRFYGPSSFELIEKDFSNLRELYKSIKRYEYRPWYFRNAFIYGVFLEKENGDRRFVVLQGNHRTAILSYLGYKQILVRYVSAYYRRIRENELNDWFYVKSGECSREDALAYFDSFFKLNGIERAKRMGLY